MLSKTRTEIFTSEIRVQISGQGTCPDIPEAPASTCNISHHEPITCKSKLHLESPIAECDVDYRDLLKNQNAEVHRMRFPDQ